MFLFHVCVVSQVMRSFASPLRLTKFFRFQKCQFLPSAVRFQVFLLETAELKKDNYLKNESFPASD